MNVIFIAFFILGFSPNFVNSQSKSKCEGSGKHLPASCKTNKSGFLCCNEGVEDLIVEAVDALKADREAKGLKFSEHNLQIIANKVGRTAESRFNSTFETVVGTSNFASKTRFNGDLLCKVKAGKNYVMSYATAKHNKGDGWVALKDAPFGPEDFDDNFHTYTYRI